MDKDKEDFLKEFGEEYGYPNAPKSIDEIRSTEFKRLEGLLPPSQSGSLTNLILFLILFLGIQLQVSSTWIMLGRPCTLSCRWKLFLKN